MSLLYLGGGNDALDSFNLVDIITDMDAGFRLPLVRSRIYPEVKCAELNLLQVVKSMDYFIDLNLVF